MDAATLFGSCAALLVGIGVYALIVNPQPLRKLIAFNVLGGGVFLLFGAIARRGATLYRFEAVVGDLDFVASQPQQHREAVRRVPVVVHDQNDCFRDVRYWAKAMSATVDSTTSIP